MPDANHEALRDLVRAREAAEKDQLKARYRLGKSLLRHGRRPEGIKAWTKKYLEWIKTHVHFDQMALEVTLVDYLNEVDHVAERIGKREKAIDEAVRQAPPEIRCVIEALQGPCKKDCVNAVLLENIGERDEHEPGEVRRVAG